MSTEGSTKAVVAALGANLGIGVTKVVAFVLSGSSSMLAEAIHSFVDSANQVLLLVGGRRSQRDATTQHPFGFARYRYFYAFLVAVLLFSLGGLFALYEAWHKFQRPEPIESWRWVPIVVLLVSMALEGFSFRTALVETNKARGSRSLFGFIRHSRSPELPVVLLEDSGALLGLLFALIGVSLTLITGNGMWDAAGTAAIGLLLVAIAIILARETKSLLLGESATTEDIAAIRAGLAEAGFADVIHLRTMHLGPEDILVTAKVSVAGEETLAELAPRIDDAEARIRAAVPAARLVFIEPDVRRGDETAADGG